MFEKWNAKIKVSYLFLGAILSMSSSWGHAQGTHTDIKSILKDYFSPNFSVCNLSKVNSYAALNAVPNACLIPAVLGTIRIQSGSEMVPSGRVVSAYLSYAPFRVLLSGAANLNYVKEIKANAHVSLVFFDQKFNPLNNHSVNLYGTAILKNCIKGGCLIELQPTTLVDFYSNDVSHTARYSTYSFVKGSWELTKILGFVDCEVQSEMGKNKSICKTLL